MAKWEVTNQIEYPTDTIALCSQKTRDEFALVYNLLNRLRNLDATNGTPTDTEPYQLHVDTSTNKLQMRNADNTSWLELGKIDENYFGLTPEDISAVKNTGTIGAIYSGNDSAKPTSNLKAYDLYFAFDSKKLYYWTGTTWQLFLSLNFENLINYAQYCVLKSEVDYSGKNKILRLDATTGKANVSITGSAAQVDGQPFAFSNVAADDIIIYDSATKNFVNRSKSTALSEYAKTSDLAAYAKSADMAVTLSGYTKTTDLNSKLANYVTSTNLTNTLSSYAKTSDVNSKIATSLTAYAKTADINSSLAAYAKTADVNSSLSAYTKTADLNTTLANYVLASGLANTLSSYEKTSSVNSKMTSLESAVATSLAAYSTTSDVAVTLASYAKTTSVLLKLFTICNSFKINDSFVTIFTFMCNIRI